MSASALTIHLFGPLRVLVQGAPLPRVRTRSVEWLLALLVLRHGRAVDRSWLAGTLWLDSEETQALRNLREDLVRLRKALGGESARIQSPSRTTLSLDLAGTEVDVVRFDAAIQAGDEASLQSAVSHYSGLLLEGCYAGWVTLERERREQACLSALETLAEYAEQRDDLGEALALLRRAEGMDGLRDTIQRSLMRVLAASGDTPAALMTYREHRLSLHREMNVEPDAETTRLFQQIRATSAGPTRQTKKEKPTSAAPPPESRTHIVDAAMPAPLPHPLTTLIGREQAVREIVQQVAVSRLVTLAGAGGVGKTRLAIQVAAEVADDFTNGVAFVSLASLSDPALLPAFVASALGLRDEGTAETELRIAALAGWLSVHEVLLVLDNCEHLIEATAQLCQTLLERCPHLHILATSRQRLGLTGEVVWRVPSLLFPVDDSWLTIDGQPTDSIHHQLSTINQFPAVQLFVERARMVSSGFRLVGREDWETVAHICQHLEGIPLAIELAAARVGHLSLAQIAARLADRFRLLTGGGYPRAGVTRHQTLRALIDWSYELLSEAEQALLRRLSVFVDGWTLEAAETIADCGPLPANPPFAIRNEDVLDLLASLTDKSLVTVDEMRGAIRYRMLETVREYALEKLQEGQEETAARNQHLIYSLNAAEQLAAQWSLADTGAVLSGVDREVGNFRGALAWAQTSAAPSDAFLRLAAALWPYWEMRGSLSEGREILRVALTLSPSQDQPERAQVLLGAATLAFVQADLIKALEYARESLSLFQRHNDPRRLAAALILCGHTCLESHMVSEAESYLQEALECCRWCDWLQGSALALAHLGLVAMRREAWDQARSLLEQGLALAEAAGHAPTLALALHNRGYLAQTTGDYFSAAPLLERSLGIWRRLGHRHRVSLTLRHLGLMARQQGDLERAVSYLNETVVDRREQGNPFHLARELLEVGSVCYVQRDYEGARRAYAESLELFTLTGNEWGINGARMNLGSTLFHLNEPKEAQALHREALTSYQQSRSEDGIVWSLERLGIVEALHGRAPKAARLLGAASNAREALGSERDRWDKEDGQRAIASVRATLRETDFTTLWEEGRAMTTQQATILALEETEA